MRKSNHPANVNVLQGLITGELLESINSWWVVSLSVPAMFQLGAGMNSDHQCKKWDKGNVVLHLMCYITWNMKKDFTLWVWCTMEKEASIHIVNHQHWNVNTCLWDLFQDSCIRWTTDNTLQRWTSAVLGHSNTVDLLQPSLLHVKSHQIAANANDPLQVLHKRSPFVMWLLCRPP